MKVDVRDGTRNASGVGIWNKNAPQEPKDDSF